VYKGADPGRAHWKSRPTEGYLRITLFRPLESDPGLRSAYSFALAALEADNGPTTEWS
jgi:hypothetical protein